jgi:hypothetical protein
MGSGYRLATFTADVTCPVGHPLLAGLRAPAREIVDRLHARGFVITGAGAPIVVVAVDWCEIRNQSYDRWREVLAGVAGTVPQRVLLCSVHQHDAPVADLGAAALLAEVGLGGAMLDTKFHERAITAVAAALGHGMKHTRKVTHVGLGRAETLEVASNRRVVMPEGSVTFKRGSGSAGDPVCRHAPEGTIDPWLRTISFWDESTPLLALHSYSVHPMSHYGQGGVSADFVGQARSRRQRDEPGTLQMYVSGCSGDTTAGKYNDGSSENRSVLAGRLYDAMAAAWRMTERQTIGSVSFRAVELDLEPRSTEEYGAAKLRSVLVDESAERRERILAAMGLNSIMTLERGRPITFPCLDLGAARIVLFPAESFVEYQLMAQRMRPDSFVMSIGYGECWPGYIPTDAAFQEGFDDDWLWVAPGGENRIHDALEQVLR